ncbi:UPF0481 protein At3g47200-like [Olea europaea var. sylvestris]|uniref:UPF0481 protein At3g47200-like n=1 Tax=Olea europaea var. sylvestris TaxID=158386 RepID=UPI000C1D0454|nr:UPF0481 protein At3g47200-like [Olea europaea var. sylvestris]
MSESVTVYIDTMLKNMSYTLLKPSIFRVGDHLRSINPEAYDPQIIAIGPFHHDKPHLQNMERHKLRYLRLLLQKKEESSVERYVAEIRRLEDRARKCYAEDIHLDEDEFVKMLILDGFFIIEFLRKFIRREDVDRDDPIFQYEHLQIQLLHDLMLFENQIPFFIVDCLFNMIFDGGINIIIWPFLRNIIFPMRKKDFPEVPINGHHLLGIVHDIQCSSSTRILSDVESGNPAKMLSKIDSGNPGSPIFRVNINSAEELTVWGRARNFFQCGQNLIKVEIFDYGFNDIMTMLKIT